MKYAIGIDIGGTNTKLGAVDDKGSVLKRHEFKTTDYDNFASYMEGLERAISFLTADTDGECLGVGIGAPNGNYYKGTLRISHSEGARRLSKHCEWQWDTSIST